MSKIDKKVQSAREWLKKHADVPEAAALQETLTAWEAKVRLVDEAKKQVAAAKEAAIVARKNVAQALASAKVARKMAAKTSAPVDAPKVKKSTPVKKALPKKASPQK